MEGADRSAGYYAAHLVLIVVNLAIAVVLSRRGWRVWTSTRSSPTSGTSRASDSVPH